MMIWRVTALGLFLSFVALSCQGDRQEWVESGRLSKEGGVIVKQGVKLEFPPGSVKERAEIRIEKRTRPVAPLPKAYSLVGDVIEIHPRGLAFDRPLRVSLPYEADRMPEGIGEGLISISYHNGKGWVKIGDSEVDSVNGTVTCPLWHTAQLAVISRNRGYGIVEHEWKDGTTPLLLIHGATPVGWEGLKTFLRTSRFPDPVWVFEYPPDRGVVTSAELLSNELAELHGQYGDFKINVVGHDIGGLVGLYYALKEGTRRDDIEKAAITIATPHAGTAMADPHTPLELIRTAEQSGANLTPQDVDILFSFADALGSTGKELAEGSELLGELRQLFKEYRRRCQDYMDPGRPTFKVECFSGDRIHPLSLDFASLIPNPPSEVIPGKGDTYVSVENTKLSPIENAPFRDSHWDLMQDRRVWEDILGYLQLEFFWWWGLVQEISSSEGRKKIAQIWEQEFRLNQNDPRSFGLILDFGRNLLNSCQPDAVLLTNGDNDTFPLWWLQEKERLRRDVAVVNLSLLNTALFIKYLKGAPHRLPVSFSEEEIDSLKPLKTEDRPVYVSQQVVDDLIATNSWKRPIYYAITCSPAYLREPRILEGLVYRLLEEPASGEVDAEKCRENLYHVYSYDGLLNEKGEAVNGLDPDMERLLCWDYSAIHFQVGQVLKKKGDAAGAAAEFQQAIRFSPGRPYIRSMVAAQFEEMKMLEEAEAELKTAIGLDKDHFPAYSLLASVYGKTERKMEGIRLLAKWVQRHPDDQEAIAFLKEYAEEGGTAE